MEVFVSWSGDRSRIFAESFQDFVKRLLHPLKPWMSIEIQPGQRWSEIIGKKLSNATLGIICLTPENQNAPWILFEAGAISKVIEEARVCSILIGMDKKDLKGPLSQFQLTSLEKTEMFNLMCSLNNLLGDNKKEKELLKEEFEEKWNNFKNSLDEKLKNSNFPISSIILPQLINVLKKKGFPESEIGKTVNFEEGFESHAIYEAIFNSAIKRLYVFGRKNRKVFDKDHWWFYEKLKDKVDNGFDFRCLFLNSNAPEHVLEVAHQDKNFIDQLNTCIDNAISTLGKFGLSSHKFIKKYNTQRTFEIIVVDDAVLFAPIQFDNKGKTKKLTKSPFTITNIDTSQGRIMLENFNMAWDKAEEISIREQTMINT